MKNKLKKLSIIVPVYFNEENIPLLYPQLKKFIIDNNKFDYEIVFVDDGSQDNSYQELLKLTQIDPNIKVIKLAKNFGSHTAILAGLSYCTGDCATSIAADLQDPPEIILEMFGKWLNGSKVVLAVRADREESRVQKFFSNTYYKLMKKFALKDMPEGGFDCFLIDRKVINILSQLEEKNTSIMGQILWCGFKPEKIYYVRKKREVGESKWTLSKKIKLFVDSFMAFSYFPIRFISSLGFIIAGAGFIYGIIIILNKFINGTPIQGWTSLMVMMLFLFGINMVMLGILGEYLWRNFDETRKRPVFIIEEKVGFNNDKENL
ncbi:MAG: glycosyltransferase family 2 protein [Cellulosilyticaceae bacterium]